MLTNEINNKDTSKSHQVIESNVVRILRLDLTLLFIEMIEIKFSWFKTGVNLANSVLRKLITHLRMEISVN